MVCLFAMAFTFIIDAGVLVLFQLRWSDIFDKSKVVLKPIGFSDIIFAFICAKLNITRRMPNITAQQYNLPQGKYN